MDASMYCESYLAEIEVLKEKSQLMTEFIDMQKQIELQENKSVHHYIETKIRKL